MIIIKPEIVNTAKLISSNVPISEYPAWVSGTNYTVGQMVYYQPMGEPYPHDYRLYNDGENHTIPPDQQPMHWLDLGASNRFRLFDQIVSNPTSNSGSIDFTVRMAAIINGIALFGLVAASVRVVMTDPVDGMVYDKTVSLTDYSAITSYFTYQFEPVGDRMEQVLFLDLPTYPAADIRIVIDNGAAIARCGEVALGQQKSIGITNYGTTIGIQDYSRKEVDQFGNFIIVERKFAKTADYDVTMQTDSLAAIQRYFADIRALPVVFIGDPDREETVVYGFYKDFRVPIQSPVVTSGNIRAEGLT